MDFIVADIQEIANEIIKEKLIAKNKKYGNSVYEEKAGVFNDGSIEDRIGTRLDDKLRRLKTLDRKSDKYDSELKEIVGYLLLLINVRKKRMKKSTYEVLIDDLEEKMNKKGDTLYCSLVSGEDCQFCGTCMNPHRFTR